VSERERCDTKRMRTTLLRPSLPYIMDLETGISFPRDRVSPSRNTDPISRDVIRQQAYSLWEAEGHPDNRGLANWLDAETLLQPTSPLRVRAIPAVRLDPHPHARQPTTSFAATASAPVSRKAVNDYPSPLCREAAGDDLRDYAFHLYVQSGCDEAGKAECWTEARLCLDARVPTTVMVPKTGWGQTARLCP
jgi:hypothetical protein